MGFFTFMGVIGFFIPFRKIVIDHQGISNQEFGNKYFVPWRDFVGLAKQGDTLILQTHSGPLKIGVGQFANNKILNAIATFYVPKQTTRPSGRIFGQ